MEMKKNPKMNLEKRRGIFFQIGLISSLSLALVAFEWTTVRIWTPEKPYDDGGEIAVYPPIELMQRVIPVAPEPEIEIKKKPPVVIVAPQPSPTPNPGENPEPEPTPTNPTGGFVPLGIDSVEGPEPPKIFVEKMPSFVGGENALFSFLAKKIVYPIIPLETGIQGTVYVDFIIEKDGFLSEISIKKGVHKQLDNEAIRVVKSMPNWIPGQQMDRKVRVRMCLPIKFKISSKY